MTAHISDPFFQVPTHSAATSAGAISLPIFVYDATNLVAFFYCSRARAENMLQGTGLEPAFMVGRWALTALSVYEYRRTSAGSYNEVGLALPVVQHGKGRLLKSIRDIVTDAEDRDMGFFVLDLPVSSAEACTAGQELWGFPKFVTDIPIHARGRQFRSRVFHPSSGQVIATLAGKLGPGLPIPPQNLLTYSYQNGALLRTTMDVRGKTKVCLPGSLKLLVGSSQHPMAERMRQLGLHDSQPLLVLFSDKFQARLNSGITS